MTAAPAAPATTRTAAPARATQPSLGRLTVVELRKMTDTRAGAWLLAIVALIAAGMVLLSLFTGDPGTRTLAGFFQGTLLPVSILLPVLGIMSVTSEWSQRTAVTTFTLVPVRWRTTLAKLLAGVVLAALSVVACLAVAAAGNLLVGPLVGGDGGWAIEPATIGRGFVAELISIVMGMAFGMAFMSTPLAIVLYFLLPAIWSTLGQFIDALRTAREWLDQSVTLAALTAGEMTGESWAKVAATAGVWVLLPLVVGMARLTRREVS